MSRYRGVKPELFKHEVLFDAERASGLPLRLAYIGLWTECDREGRFKWRPRSLAAAVLPFDEVDFGQVLVALEGAGLVRSYEVDGERYGVVPRFKRHQHINGMEAKSEIPEPPVFSPPSKRAQDAGPTRDEHAASVTVHVPVHVPVPARAREADKAEWAAILATWDAAFGLDHTRRTPSALKKWRAAYRKARKDLDAAMVTALVKTAAHDPWYKESGSHGLDYLLGRGLDRLQGKHEGGAKKPKTTGPAVPDWYDVEQARRAGHKV